jgi:hypothetical protein
LFHCCLQIKPPLKSPLGIKCYEAVRRAEEVQSYVRYPTVLCYTHNCGTRTLSSACRDSDLCDLSLALRVGWLWRDVPYSYVCLPRTSHRMKYGIRCACLCSFIYLPALVGVYHIHGLFRKFSHIYFTYRYVAQYF